MDYFFCDVCKRYYLNVFREWHNKKHKYMILKLDEKTSVLEDLERVSKVI